MYKTKADVDEHVSNEYRKKKENLSEFKDSVNKVIDQVDQDLSNSQQKDNMKEMLQKVNQNINEIENILD